MSNKNNNDNSFFFNLAQRLKRELNYYKNGIRNAFMRIAILEDEVDTLATKNKALEKKVMQLEKELKKQHKIIDIR